MKSWGLLFISCVCSALCSVPASAQSSTRTWVSGLGNDSNPCSVTMPCQTFARAIAVTTAGGEIDCLDPGGFGTLTITQSVSIVCLGAEAGVLASGTNGITINAPGIVVYLQGIDFEGFGSGLSGISFLNGASLVVKNSTFRGFITQGITFAPSGSGTSYLSVDHTIVTNQTVPNAGGILIAPTGGSVASALITDSHLDGNLYGLRVQDNGTATVTGSSTSNNTNNGFLAVSSSAAAIINFANGVSANNGINGIATSGANALITIVNTGIYNNKTGINTGAGGTVTSFSPATNSSANNGTAGAPNGSPIPMQ